MFITVLLCTALRYMHCKECKSWIKETRNNALSSENSPHSVSGVEGAIWQRRRSYSRWLSACSYKHRVLFNRKCMVDCVRRKDSLLLIERNKMRDSREGGAIECFKEGKCKIKLAESLTRLQKDRNQILNNKTEDNFSSSMSDLKR